MVGVLLVAGDTFPSKLTYKNAGVPVDITGYAFVLKVGYAIPLVKNAVITNAAKGEFEIRWAAGDLATGTWPAEMLIRYPDLTEQTQKLGGITIRARIA